MHGEAILAIDAGGSYVKASLFFLASGKSRTAGRGVDLIRSHPGFNERDPGALWQATVHCIREVLQASPADPPQVTAVGLTGHGNGLYLVDGGGLPSRNAIMASDGRAAQLVRNWVRDGVEERIRPHAWNGLWAGKPGPVLAWLARHQPEALDASHAVLGCKDYLRARLTGRVATETSDATAGGLYDASALISDPDASLQSSPLVLDALGIGAHRRLLLPTIGAQETFEVSPAAARETGLGAGTAVVAGLVDNAAMQHGSGVFDGSKVCVGAGTWSINQLLVPLEEMTPEGSLGQVRPYAANSALGGRGLLCEASATSASSLDWALRSAFTATADRDREAGRDIFEGRLQREGTRTRRIDDPMFFPFVDGSREDAAARGAWLGLSSASTEEHLLGAVVEGVCFEHRRHVERLERSLPGPLPVRISGGATRSPTWCQRFADALGRPVEASAVAEPGLVCAAALAAHSAGLVTSVADGVERLGPQWQTYRADASTASFMAERWARYSRWAGLLESDRWGV